MTEQPAGRTVLDDSGSPPNDARYVVVSVDGHVGPMMTTDLRPYCPAQHLGTFDDFVREAERQAEVVPGGPSFLSETYLRRREAHAGVDGLRDPHARLRDLDADGIAGEVIYHGGLNQQAIPFTMSTMFSYASASYRELESVGVRIYNRWLADFVSVAPDRLVGLAHLPIPDVEACVREVEWARAAGLTAVNLPAPRRELADFNDPVWEPLWSACAANDMVLSTHGAGGDRHPYSGRAASAIGLMEIPFFARRGVWILILSGVFERHPNLKLVTTEQYGDWVPEMLRDLDSAYDCFLSPQDPLILPRPPSEYWHRNCFVGASFMSRLEAELARDRGLDANFMWGADYPHPEGTWPRTAASLRATFAGLDPSHVQKLLGSNAARVYAFDVDALNEIARWIGPTVADVAEPLHEVPDEFPGFAFRRVGKFG